MLPAFSEEPATLSQEDQDRRRRVERKYLRYAGVGIQFGLTLFLFTLAGVWLDDRFDTSPLLTVLLMLLGFGGATYSLVRQVLGPGNRK